MNDIKITDKQTLRLKFTHINGLQAALYVALNPLTDQWLQEHRVGDGCTAYVGTKTDALHLANAIVTKSEEKGLPCIVEIGDNSMMP